MNDAAQSLTSPWKSSVGYDITEEDVGILRLELKAAGRFSSVALYCLFSTPVLLTLQVRAELLEGKLFNHKLYVLPSSPSETPRSGHIVFVIVPVLLFVLVRPVVAFLIDLV
ncbi:hypothetical protein PoB_000003900 [Plakobranchus ocellatus]|uniref:Uncharacterized protein n=1 Tax=Plakobranchus ocellatus TaxID=259542 RepID=A0AAV3XU79_9GAST|nr:hypothetical protein PoB_000003900 [Plakobranchus ocellatus]